MKQNLLETFIGFLVLGIALAFLIYTYQVQNREVTEEYTLSCTFQSVDGINKGSDVDIAGIIIGKVSSLTLDPKTYNAVLTLSVDKKVKIPTDSRAAITSSGFLGGKYVSITPGGDDAFLEDGAQIKYTQSSINLESLIGKFMYSNSQSSQKTSTVQPEQAK